MSDSEALIAEVERIFGPQGPLVESGRFSFRPVQLEMARRVAQHICEETSALIESGTGTGKTAAYLVPLLLTGRKTVVATGTKTLQDQIMYKDLPFLLETLNLPAKAVCMKGRQNYVCKLRLNQTAAQGRFTFLGDVRIFERILAWAENTDSGDRAEMAELPDDYAPWSEITSSSDNCLGSHCTFFETCFITRMRRRAQAADLIIANHHLFFADLAVKEGNFGQVIPGFELLLFDEAHLLESTATQYFGFQASSYRVVSMVDDIVRNLNPVLINESGLDKQLDRIKPAAEDFFSCFRLFGERETRFKITKELIDYRMEAAYMELDDAINSLLRRLRLLSANDIRFEAFIPRCEALLSDMARVMSFEEENYVHWGEIKRRSVALNSTPLDVAPDLREKLFGRYPGALFTSATLSTGDSFDYMRKRLGCPEETAAVSYPSPFEYKKQLCIYLPGDIPEPAASGYPDALEREIRRLLDLAQGRTLALFTSYAMLEKMYERLNGKIPYRIFRQGEAPRNQLLESFRDDVSSVLFATGSFWQGVDVMGESLSCVIIDKLPFEYPGDPVTEARIEYIRKNGGQPFADYQLPTAIIQLKQGVGRLIRDSRDWGVAAVLDRRLLTKSYGRSFLRSLPPGEIMRKYEDVCSWWRNSEKP